MNIKKLFISVFAAAFLIGTFVYFLMPTQKVKKEISFEKATKILKNNPPIEANIEQDSDDISENDLEWVEEYDANFKIKMLTPGEFHGEEVIAKSGETWLGLFKKGNDFSLLQTKIKVKSVYDPMDYDKKRKKTGKSVEVVETDQPIFLIKNADFLKRGNINTIFDIDNNTDDKPMNNVYSRKFKLDKTTYNLFVTTEKEKGSWLDKTSRLVLSDGKTEQIIYSQKLCDDCGWGLLWAGDLDGDGKLDLFLDLTNHYNVSHKRLFLSSKAEKGKLIKEIANFRNVGC